MKDYNNPKDNVLCPHCAKSPCEDAMENEIIECKKCGEETQKLLVGDEIAYKCPSCGFYTTE